MVLCWELILQSFNTTKIPHNFTGIITSKVVLLFKRFMISNYKKTKGEKRKQKKWNCLTDAAILLRIKDAEFMNMQYLFHFINDVKDNNHHFCKCAIVSLQANIQQQSFGKMFRKWQVKKYKQREMQKDTEMHKQQKQARKKQNIAATIQWPHPLCITCSHAKQDKATEHKWAILFFYTLAIQNSKT